MSTLSKRHRLLLATASIGYLIPCSYNIRTGMFASSHRNTFACVCNVLFFGCFVWYDFVMILKFYTTLPIVLVGILAIDVTVYNLLIFCIILNVLYNRVCIMQLLNSLFARDDWMLETAASVSLIPGSWQCPSTHSASSLVCLIVLVILYGLYNALFINDQSTVLMDMIILLRFCYMFLFLELYRVCVSIIKQRMKQLQVLFKQMENIDTAASIDQMVHLFLERFQRYYSLIESVNKCFSVPVTHILLLIVLERTVAAYDAYEHLREEKKNNSWEFYGLVYRQVWELTYIVLMVLLAITCNAASMQSDTVGNMSTYIRQNHFTLRIIESIYFLPVSYSQTAQRFVQKRTNLVSFSIGMLLASAFFYHDFFIQNVFFANLAPFAFAVVLLELLLYATIPFCVVLNNFYNRKRLTELLNILFADDSVLDSTNITRGSAYLLYIYVLSLLVVMFELCNLFALENITHKMLTTTFVLRFMGVIHFLYLFHLCVSMVGLRMEQLKMFFHRKQTEETEEIEFFIGLFIARFERYVVQIDEINRCFSLPIVIILALGMIELAYFAFECFHTFDTGAPDSEMYNGYADWALCQFWQAMYCHFLVLTVSSCERTWKKRYRLLFTAATVMYILPCSYNYRTFMFEQSWPNKAALVLNIVFHSACLWLDLYAIKISIGTMSIVMLGVIVIYLVICVLMLFVFVWNAFYSRSTFVHLFNALFAQDDLMLEWAVTRRRTDMANWQRRHSGNMGLLALLVVLNSVYNFMFAVNSTIFKLYFIILLRFCGMFLMVELYRACVIVINERMEQLWMLLVLTKTGTKVFVDHNVELFLERFQRYYELIECVDRCFAVPIIHSLLLIVLERTVAAYDLYDNYPLLNKMSAWEIFSILFRQIWQMIYLAIVFMIGITTCVRVNRNTFRIIASVYYLPVSYDTGENRFIEKRSNFVSLAIGLLLSIGFMYHDFFLVLAKYYNSMSAFTLAVFIVELAVFATVPICTVCNSFIHRKQIVQLLNVLFEDENVLDVGATCSCKGFKLMNRYVKLTCTVLTLLCVYDFLNIHNFLHVLLELTLVSRFLLMTQYLYLYYLCVSMVRLRMKQMKVLLLHRRHEHDFEQFLGLFMDRFGRYVALIEPISQCLSAPLLGMLLQAMIELAYSTYEWFRVLSTGQIVDGNYISVQHWISSQFGQLLYGNVLLLIVPFCELASNEHTRIFQISSLLYFTPCSYNEQLGLFEATRRNLAMCGVAFGVTIPFWVYDIRLMVSNFLSTYTTVFAAVGSIELLIYVSVVMCTMLNVFVKRKRITRLMNVLFRPDRILDRCSAPKMLKRYEDNRKLLAFSLLILIGFGIKFSFYKSVEIKILAMMIAGRFLAIWILIFVHRLHVRAIAQRMEQLRVLYASDELVQHLDYFLERYDRYAAQIAEVNDCYSLPVVLVFLLVMLQLIYLAEFWYSTIETGMVVPVTESFFYSLFGQLWQTLYGALGYYSISACSKTSEEVEETALCTRHFDDYRLQNTRAAKQIQKFLLKNLHQKKKFSACGFFDIDNTVIYMVFSSIVTYLVILIQFKQLETDLTQSPDAYNVTSNLTTVQP
uniref:Gustatory receptor n=1 Tax=Anopheles christyi TaxID=43041 RepID=A0A182K6B5_9DIPT